MMADDAQEAFPFAARDAALLPHKVYLALWYRIVGFLFAVLFFGAASVFAFALVSRNAPLPTWILGCPFLGLGAFFMLVAVKLWRPAVILSPDRIQVATLLGSRTLGRSEIAGMTPVRLNRGGEVFALVPKDKKVRRVAVPALVRQDPLAAGWLAGLPEVSWRRR
jgi:hypothetical protein